MANEVRLVPRQGFVIILGDGQVKLTPKGGFVIDELVVATGPSVGSSGYTLKRKRKGNW